MRLIQLTNENGCKVVINADYILAIEDCQVPGRKRTYRSKILMGVVGGKKPMEFHYYVKESTVTIKRLIESGKGADNGEDEREVTT